MNTLLWRSTKRTLLLWSLLGSLALLDEAACSNSSPTLNQPQSIAGTTRTPAVAGTTVVGGAAAASGAVSAGVAGATAGVSGVVQGVAGAVALAGSGGTAGVAGSHAVDAGAAGAAGSTGAAGVAGSAAVGGDAGSAGSAGAAGSTGPDEGCPPPVLGVGDHTYMINSANGMMYSYIISIPKTVDATKRTPLLVHWHALSSDPTEARSVTSIDAKVDAAAWIVVYPISPDKSWDLGSCCTNVVNGKHRDEEVFARELIKDVESKVCVDTKHVYTNGFSNGGMMSQMLACKMTDVFAASAPMGSTLTIAQTDCTPSRAIPIFMINGTADPLVGYNAPGIAGGLSVPDDVKFWAAKNKCTDTPSVFLQMGKATCSRYTQCDAGVEVAYCAVDGMGHCVPGMKKESATVCLTKTGIALGMPNDDIDGIQMDMDFLKRFSLP